MSCDEVREQLVDHLLGTLDEPVDLEVRRHVRGCSGCRREMTALAEGVGTFARAAHQLEPPPELEERVLSVLRDEWAEAPAQRTPRRGFRRLAWAAAVIALAGSLAWGYASNVRADRNERAAIKYESFLGVLGGENVRVGVLRPVGSQQLEGSAVLYDSKVEQSWVLVLVRAPGMKGEARMTLSSPDGRTIELFPAEFGRGGEAAGWLVTSSNLRPFDTLTIRDAGGVVIAEGTVSAD